MTRSRFAGPVAVAVVIGMVTWGSGLWAGGSGDEAIEVGPGLSVTPPPGWVTSTSTPEPFGWQGVAFTDGASSLRAVDAIGASGSSAGVLDAYVEAALAGRVEGVVLGQPGTLSLPNGRQAIAVGYVGTSPSGLPVEGLLVATLRDGGAVVFDVTTPQGSLVDVAADVRAAIGSAVIG